MSVFIDRNFLLRISPKLTRFTRKKDDLFNFRCPLCGDSQKSKTKCRGFVYRKKNDYFYMCHNCSASMSFYSFLKILEPELAKEYTFEKYKSGETATNHAEPNFAELKIKPAFKEKLKLPTIESLDDNHHAKAYIQNRKIPKEYWSELYFCDDYKALVDSYGIEKDIFSGDQRVVIPFYDKENNLIGFQGRALGESKLRYITIRLQESATLLYGMNRVDENEKIYVLEGPFDSMFLPNAVATTNSNLEAISNFFDKSKVVLVFDNEPRNKEIVNLMEKAIDEHYNICIWPEMIEEKDINEMVLNDFSVDEIQDIIDTNTFVNLRAKMEFVNWKKIDNTEGIKNGRRTIK